MAYDIDINDDPTSEPEYTPAEMDRLLEESDKRTAEAHRAADEALVLECSRLDAVTKSRWVLTGIDHSTSHAIVVLKTPVREGNGWWISYAAAERGSAVYKRKWIPEARVLSIEPLEVDPIVAGGPF